MAQRIKITDKQSAGDIIKHRKTEHFFKQISVVANTKLGIEEVVCLRLYQRNTTTSPCHACLWVTSYKKEVHITGGGSASGYGYCKMSAAAADAIANAGIELSVDISGVGMIAVIDTLLTLARKLGYANSTVIQAEG